MPGAVIVINQPTGAGAGSPGVARKDIWQNQQVQLVDGAGGNTSWEWTLLYKPPGSAAALTGDTTSTASFTPDQTGTYRVQLITNGGGPGNVQIKVLRVRFDATGTIANRGWALPAKDEIDGENNFGGTNTESWAEAFEYIFADIQTSLDNAAAGAAGGDLGGLYPNPSVLKIHGTTVPTTSGGDVGKFLKVSSAGVAVWDVVSSTLAGDVTGPLGANTVVGLTNVDSDIVVDGSVDRSWYLSSASLVSGDGATLYISAGDGVGPGHVGGGLNLLGSTGGDGTGVAAAGNGGHSWLVGGMGGVNGGAGGGAGGEAVVQGGIGTSSAVAGGRAYIDGGDNPYGGTKGHVEIGTVYAPQVDIGRGGQDTRLLGTLQLFSDISFNQIAQAQISPRVGQNLKLNTGGGSTYVSVASLQFSTNLIDLPSGIIRIGSTATEVDLTPPTHFIDQVYFGSDLHVLSGQRLNVDGHPDDTFAIGVSDPTSPGNGINLSITGGSAVGSGNSPGAIEINGAAALLGEQGGAITMYGGVANGSGGVSGDVTFDAGGFAGGATGGNVGLGLSYANQVLIGRAGKTTTINGLAAVADPSLTVGGAKVSKAPIKEYVYGIAGLQQTAQTTGEDHGAFSFNPASHFAGDSALARTFRLAAVLECATAGQTCSLELYNYTDSVTVTTLTTTNTTPSLVTTTLTVPTNLPNSEKVYVFRLKRTGGTSSDFVSCKMARLEVIYS